jgi:hypothetical protein
MLRLQLPRLAGLGVADKVYSPTGHDSDATPGYPLVTVGKRTIEIETSMDSLAPGASAAVFREPPRLWVREPAAGKSIALDYSVYARGLREPVRDSLTLRIVPTHSTAVISKRANQSNA